jgi:hypothetical protein
MATEPTSGVDNTEIFKQLEEYPWDSDKEFLVNTFNSLSASASLLSTADISTLLEHMSIFTCAKTPIQFQS